MAERLLDRPSIRTDIAEVLNKLRMVRWDRLTFDEAASTVAVYGWIARGDPRQDFILIHFVLSGAFAAPPQAEWRQFFTSSAKYSEEIYELLNGGPCEGHIPCERVEVTLDGRVAKAINAGGDRG